ncbi:MAG: LPS assembly lipoprotein LptE [Pseudomonadota bacterium]
MSWSDRRSFLAGSAALLTSACGFRPLYQQDGGAAALIGTISLQEATDPITFAARERLRRRLGDGGSGAPYALLWLIDIQETGVAITPTADITRYQLDATLQYRLVDQASNEVVEEGRVKTSGAYDATAEAFASRAAALDERQRISIELAELTATRLLASASLE